MENGQAASLKIVIGTNTLTEIQQPAYVNHCQFWFRLGRSYPHINFIFSAPPRMSIDRMRNMTAKVALSVEADYVLFLDDDVIVNPNYGLKQLIDCDADIAAGKVCVRGWPFDYMVFKHTEEDPEGLHIQQTLPDHGIHECDAVGFSFALIKTNVIRRLKEPWFITGINNTEDIYFCKRARTVEPTLKIVVNCDCNCGHILWPEIMDQGNRAAYKEYMKAMYPSLASEKPPEQQPRDRGQEYLDSVKRTVEKANA